MPEEIDEGLAVAFAHTADVERYAVYFQLALVFVIVELGLVQRNELQKDHADGEDFALKEVIARIKVVPR